MRNETLLDLVDKWESLSVSPDAEDGSPEAEVQNAYARGKREGLKKAVEELTLAIKLFSTGVSDE